jgi:hypothetical protein
VSDLHHTAVRGPTGGPEDDSPALPNLVQRYHWRRLAGDHCHGLLPSRGPAVLLVRTALCSARMAPGARAQCQPRKLTTTHPGEGTDRRDRWAQVSATICNGPAVFRIARFGPRSTPHLPYPLSVWPGLRELTMRRPLSNRAGTPLAGRHRHMNRARRGIRCANLEGQGHRPEGGVTWL